MTPEQLNRLAMWGTIGILVVAAAILGVRQSVGDRGNPIVVLPASENSAFGSPSTGSVTAEPPTTSTTADPAVQNTDSTVTRPGSSVESVAADLIRSGVAQSTTTTSVTTSTTSVVAETSTTTSAPPSTTGGVSTTVPTTTTTVPTTTTTVPTTTTTVPTTTTTTVPATTTTTVPATTTTTVPAPGLFVIGFDGQAEGDDDDDWSVVLSVSLGSTVSGTWRAQVYVSWSGAGSGRTVLETGGSGKASAVVGPFDGDSVVFTVEDIRSSGWVYLPGLNRAMTRLSVAAPAD